MQLQIIALIIPILGICATSYYFWRGNRRKRLAFRVVASKLIGDDDVDASQHQIVISHNREELTNPHLVAVTIANIGGKDVSSNDFDSKKPLRFDTGASIVTILKSESRPEDAKLERNQLLIGPTMLSHNSELTVKLLVEGLPKVTLCANPLIETDILDQRERIEKAEKGRKRVRVGTMIFLAILIIDTAVSVFGFTVSANHTSDGRRQNTAIVRAAADNPSASDVPDNLRRVADWISDPGDRYTNLWWLNVAIYIFFVAAVFSAILTLCDILMRTRIREIAAPGKKKG